MRTCTKCGAQFPDDELFCPVCKQEVQLVPDFITIESRYQEEQLKKEEQERIRREEREREEEKMRRRNARKRSIIISCVLTALVVIGVIAGILIFRAHRKTQSYEYQYALAEELYGEGRYDAALEAVNAALGFQPKDFNARLMLARIYINKNANGKATTVLTELTNEFPKEKEPWELLFSVYETQGNTAAIQKLLDTCPFEDLVAQYAAYRPSAPVFKPAEGEYDEFIEVSITAETEGPIHYTIDGREPGADSPTYTGPIKLDEEKSVTVKAMLISKVGVQSDTVSAKYTIKLKEPPAPVITPKSGSYTRRVDEEGNAISGTFAGPDDSDYMITVEVPEGYTCFYSFDKRPTENSTRYTGPVEMRTGEHVFYAVLKGENGKLGKVASATYLYTETTPTPTPTPVPYYYYYPSDTQYSEEVPQETDADPEPTEAPSDAGEPPAGTDTDPSGGDTQNTSDDGGSSAQSTDNSSQSTDGSSSGQSAGDGGSQTDNAGASSSSSNAAHTASGSSS